MSAQQMIEAAKIEEALRNLSVSIDAPEALCELITPLSTRFLIEALSAESKGCNPAEHLINFYETVKSDLFAEFDCDSDTQAALNAYENQTMRTA